MAKEKKEQSALKKLFSPIEWNWGLLIRPFLSGYFFSFFTILTVETFKRATTLIQNYDAEWVKKLIIAYIIIVLIFIAFNYSIKNTSVKLQYKWTQLIQK